MTKLEQRMFEEQLDVIRKILKINPLVVKWEILTQEEANEMTEIMMKESPKLEVVHAR